MDNNYLISVIVPIYNTEAYLERSLKSILNNTYKNIELICIDDKSTDGSLEILKKTASSDPRVKVIEKKQNSGLCVTRDLGIKLAAGDFILFIDSDDWIHKRCIELLLKAQSKYNSDITICRPFVTEGYIPDNDEDDELLVKKLSLNDMYNDNDAKRWRWGRLYRTILLKDKVFPQLRFSEDKGFNLAVVIQNRSASVAIIDNKLYYYFIRRNSIVRTADHEIIRFLGDWCIEQLEGVSDQQLRQIILIQAYNAYLSARFMSEVKKDSDTHKYEIIFHKLNEYMKTAQVDSKKRIMYTLMGNMPIIYRYYRILTDRTLIQFRKEQRRKG